MLNSTAVSHHERHNPWSQVEKHAKGTNDMSAEIKAAADFIVKTSRDWCRTHVVYSNHDDHFPRWLRDTDWRDDPCNAELYLRANLEMVRAIKAGREFDIFEWALRDANPEARFDLVDCDGELIIHGVMYHYHGDKGVNGGKGTTVGLSRLGRPITKAHDHTLSKRDDTRSGASIIDPALARYAKGATTWVRGVTVGHSDGSRQSFQIIGCKYRA